MTSLAEKLVAAVMAGLASLVLLATPAQAEGFCPPGFFPIGGGSGGWVGCAPMDGGVGGTNDSNRSMADHGVSFPATSSYKPVDWAAYYESLRQSKVDRAREAMARANPDMFAILERGLWVHGRSPPGNALQACAATFWTVEGGVVLLDWAGKHPGTFLAFFGWRINETDSIVRARMRLEQSGESQTVEVFQAGFPPVPGMGMIMFRVPSTSALLASIEDAQDYAVFEGDIKLASGAWHSGHAAGDALKACIDARGR